MAKNNEHPRKNSREISRSVLERLARYHQIASRAGAEGQGALASAYLAEVLGVDDTLVRKDMAAANISGRPKIGYAIAEVLERLEDLLGLADRHEAILIGCGHLGGAIANYPGFSQYGLKITAVFDTDYQKVGQKVGYHLILPMEKCRSVIEIFRVKIAILAAPDSAAQELANWLVERGITAIWNFAPLELRVPPEVVVRNENLALGLAQLMHQVNQRKKKHEPDRHTAVSKS